MRRADDDQSITFATAANIQRQRAHGVINPSARLLHRIQADTWEEASAVHHIKLGWEPYVPAGPAEPCPYNCGALYDPQGSGECPNCGSPCQPGSADSPNQESAS